MANYNKVILVGNLTRDPQLTYLPSQTPVVEFGMAVNRNWTGQDGQKREEVCFIDLRAYGKPAEIINHYMAKGRPLLVEGRLQFDQWQAQDGTKRSRHRVIVENFQFLGGAPGAGGPGAAAQTAPPVRSQAPTGPPAEDISQDAGQPAPPDNPPPPSGKDIPF